MRSSIPSSKYVTRIVSAQRASVSKNVTAAGVAVAPNCSNERRRIFFSTLMDGYACSTVIGNRSRNASFNRFVPTNRPSSEPRPLVFAVAKTVNPGLGAIVMPSFLMVSERPSSTGWRHITLGDAKSISSMVMGHPRSIATGIGPSSKTVSPFFRRNPPMRSSSSVSRVMLIRICSTFSSAHACST